MRLAAKDDPAGARLNYSAPGDARSIQRGASRRS
jgi:hypothetical protein